MINYTITGGAAALPSPLVSLASTSIVSSRICLSDSDRVHCIVKYLSLFLIIFDDSAFIALLIKLKRINFSSKNATKSKFLVDLCIFEFI